MFMRSVENCCAAGFLGGWGHSHGGETHSTFESFATTLYNLVGIQYVGQKARGEIYYGLANSSQSEERNWLKQLGFDEIRQGSIYLLSISGNKLTKGYSTVFAEKIRKQKEAKEERKRKEAEKKAAAKAERERKIANGEIPKPRARGEFRVNDKVYKWVRNGEVLLLDDYWNRHRWDHNGVVERVNIDGTITIRNPAGNLTTIKPVVSTGNSRANIQRTYRY